MPVNRNVLYTCLGSPTVPVVDFAGPVPLQQGDKLMLCSDGLWGNLSLRQRLLSISIGIRCPLQPLNWLSAPCSKGGEPVTT